MDGVALGEKIVFVSNGTTHYMEYMRDENGEVYGFIYDGGTYFLEKNALGDVKYLLNGNGGVLAKYAYDEWGKVISVTDANGNEITDKANVAHLNPFRYRSYYYDWETGFYYLSSRYYDPSLCRFINADGLLDKGSITGMNLFAYCLNNPAMFVDPFGLCAKAWAAGYFGPCPGQGLPGCMDNWPQFQDNSTLVSEIDRNSPPDHPDYTPPKKSGGKKVKNPNGEGWGWPAKDGGVWMPDPKMHGGEGWTIQYPGGGHSHAYPGGGVRNHFQAEQSTGESVIMIFGGALLTAGLIADDYLGIGVVDDPLLVGSTGCFIGGLNGLLGKKVCTECGEIYYGY